MTVNLTNLQRSAVSFFGALVLATLFVGSAIGPADAAVLVQAVL